MALGWWSFVDEDRLLKRVESLGALSGRDCRELLGFLEHSRRLWKSPSSPNGCVLGFRDGSGIGVPRHRRRAAPGNRRGPP